MKTIVLLILAAATMLAGTVTGNPQDVTWEPGEWSAVLLEEHAGYRNLNRLLAMTVDQTSVVVIFEGLAGPGASTNFTMPGEWALMLDSPDGLFSSVGGLSADGMPHFFWQAPYAYGEDLWLYGDADWFTGGDGVDMKVSLTPTPEPATLLLVGLGLIGLGCWRKRCGA